MVTLRHGAAAVGLLAVGGVILFLGGRSFYQHELMLPAGQHCEKLEHMNISNAAGDAADDARLGVRRLLAFGGVRVLVRGPGGQFVAPNYRVENLPCTGDAIYSRRHEMLMERACAYAAAYNKASLSQPGAPKPNFASAYLSTGC